ncbi:MAG: PAS domain S-box protein, partial [Proteobacteria bacterium]|nr:PAS domain S-box protein [Pseudomonadota bacterium]
MAAKTILVVADEATPAALVRRAFEERRFVLVAANSLGEARKYLAGATPDLVIVDLRLPDGAGTDLLADGRPPFPVVVMTGQGDQAAAVQAMKAGALDCVVKSAEVLADLPRLAERALREWDHIVGRRRAEEALRRANRTLKLLSECNQALIRATEESALVSEICQLIVEEGGYRLAWVGLAENDENKSVRPTAQAGFEDGYLDTLRITWADTERGRGPAGTAIRTGSPVVCRNIQTDPNFALWREEALQRGYASMIAIPLIDERQVLGTLNIYSPEPDAFDDDEVSLLEELAADVSFGVMVLRTRERRRRAEEELRKSERLLANAQRLAHVGGWEWDVRTGEVEWSEEVYRIFGLDSNDFQPTIDSVMSRFHPDDRIVFDEVMARAKGDRGQYIFETRILWPDGGERRLISTSEGHYDDGELVQIAGVVQDVSERQAAEEALREAEERYRLLFNKSNDAIFVHGLDDDGRPGRFIEVNDVACQRLGYSREELLGRSPLDIGVEADPDEALAIGRRLLAEGQAEFATTHRTKDGRLIPVESNARLFELRGQRAVLSVSRDITERRRAEEVLRESEHRLRLTFDEAPVGAAITDPNDFRFIRINNQFCRFLGYTEDELQRLTFRDITLPDDLATDVKSILRLRRGEIDRYSREKRYLRKDGQEVWGRLSVSLVRDDAGAPLYFIPMVEDITDRKRAEEALKESEHRFRELVDHMSSGVAVYEAVDDGRDFIFKDFNQAAERITGVKREEVFGRSVREVFPGVTDLGLFEVFGRVFKTGQPEPHPAAMYRDERLEFWVDNDIYRLPSGEIVAVFDDITDQKKAEEALRQSEERYRQIVETANEGIWVLDARGDTSFVNHRMAKMLGYTVADMLGRPLFDFMDDEGRVQAEIQLARRRAGVEETHEFRFVTKNGDDLWAIISTNPWFDAEGRFKGALGMVTDITDRKTAETALRMS